MVKPADPDKVLIKMPSLRAVRSFVAAAKYLNFTRAAESLCVSQAAISRQIRELEAYMGVELFKRVGRAVELTEAGSIFYDAAYLSFVNIAQAAERTQGLGMSKRSLTICCSPAFSDFWLADALADFMRQYPEIQIQVVCTEQFLQLEPGVYPDVFINKSADPREGYRSIPLFHDLIYPVCTPEYLEQYPEITTLDQLKSHPLLNLTPYGRSQVAEHLDWGVWFSFFNLDITDPFHGVQYAFTANTYNLLIKLVLRHQGISLGWDHLVSPLIKEGRLVRPVREELLMKEKQHYLTFLESKSGDEGLVAFKNWMLARFQKRG
jgi:LysR family glycine cleavage system transcriptional activator